MAITDHERLTRHFFRRVNSVELFKRFFEHFGVWDAMKLTAEARNDEVHAAWESLYNPDPADADDGEAISDDRREEIREALCRVNDIGRDKARYILYERAGVCGVPNYGDLTVQKLAMVLYLDHRTSFDQAYDFYMIEKTDNLHTLLGDDAAECKPAAWEVDAFKEALRKALKKEKVGPKLKVEIEDRHPDKWMATIPHQHYVKPDHEFGDDGEIVTRDRRPVYEMVLIYYSKSGLLKLKAGRGKKKVERVAAAFAEHILGEDSSFFEACEIVKFGPLKDPTFSFATRPGDHFISATPVQIRYRKKADRGTEYLVHLKEQRDGHPGVLHTVANNGSKLSEIDILSVSICFKFSKKKRDRRTVELTWPTRVPLDETDRDRHLEDVLVRWKLVDHDAKKRLEAADAP